MEPELTRLAHNFVEICVFRSPYVSVRLAKNLDFFAFCIQPRKFWKFINRNAPRMNTLSVYDVLRASLITYRKHFSALSVFTIVFGFAFFIAFHINQSAAEIGGIGVLLFAALAFFLVSFFSLMWAVRVGMSAVDGAPLTPLSIFAIVPRSWEIVWKLAAASFFLFFIFASFLFPFLSVVFFLDAASPGAFFAAGAMIRSGVTAAFIFAAILFLVSFVYLCVRFSFVAHFIIDKAFGLPDALRASWEATERAFWKLLLLFLTALAVHVLGILFFYGIFFISIPLTVLVVTHAYRTLSHGKAVVSA